MRLIEIKRWACICFASFWSVKTLEAPSPWSPASAGTAGTASSVSAWVSDVQVDQSHNGGSWFSLRSPRKKSTTNDLWKPYIGCLFGVPFQSPSKLLCGGTTWQRPDVRRLSDLWPTVSLWQPGSVQGPADLAKEELMDGLWMVYGWKLDVGESWLETL